MTEDRPSTGSGHRFSAEVLAAGGGGHAVVVPKEIAATFSAKRVAVVAHVEGVEYHSRISVYGGKSYLGLRVELLRKIDRQAGDQVTIDLVEELGADARTVLTSEVTEPLELVAGLAENETARNASASP